MGLAKESMGLGVTLGAGHSVMGAMGNIHGMPAQASGAIHATGAGLNLIGVGQVAKIGMTLVGQPSKKKTGNKYVDKILG